MCTSRRRNTAWTPTRPPYELGDVLFDTLLLIQVSSRDHGVSLEMCAASAVAKLRKRSPYIFDGGPEVATAADAQALWQASKRAEREAIATAAAVLAPVD